MDIRVIDPGKEDPKELYIDYLKGKVKKLEEENKVLRETHGLTGKDRAYVIGYLLGLRSRVYKGRK